ncbi:Ig-like domain-containing protein, partial [Trabulsiella guamensis]
MGPGSGIFTAPGDDNDSLFGLLGFLAAASAIGVGAAVAMNEDSDDISDRNAPETPAIGETIDNEGNVVGPLKSGDQTDDTTPTLSGRGEPGDTIHIYDKGKEIGSVKVGDDGKWSYTPEKPLDDGEHELTVTEKDPSGNESKPSDPIVITVDTLAPDAPAIQHVIDKVGNVVGEINHNGWTDDTRPEMSGTGEAGATITIYDNGKAIGQTEVNADGRWYFKPTQDLADGNHDITVKQTDKAGNVSDSSPVRDFSVITAAPEKPDQPEVLDKTGPKTGPLEPGDVTDETKPTFNGDGTPGNVIIIKDNGKEIGSTVVGDDGKWSYTPKDDLGEGKHELEVSEKDKAGNISDPSDPIQIVVDTTPPPKPDVANALDDNDPITGKIQDGGITDDSRPTFSGGGEPGDTVTIYDGDEVLGTTVIGDDGKWSFTPEESLDDGNHSITVTQTDPAGNTSEPSDSLDFGVDTTPPEAGEDVLKITGVADNVGDQQGNVTSGGITDDSQPAITGIGEAGNIVFVYSTDAAGKHLIGSAVVDADGKWSLTPDAPLLEGLNSLTLETQDPAGNRIAGEAPAYDVTLLIPTGTEPAITSVVDSNEPHVGALQKGDATNDNTPTLIGSAAPGDIVTIRDGSTVLGSVTADSNGKWTFTPGTALADGNHNFVVTATDAAGNHSDSGNFPISIDTAAPDAGNVAANDDVGDVTGTVKDGETTDDQSPTFGGNAEPGSVVEIIDNGKVIGSTVVGDDGKWEYTPEEPLGKGDHEITTVVTDPAGNSSEPSPGISFSVDPDPNQVTIGAVKDDQGPITGNLTDGNVTDDARPELTGSGKPGSVVTIKDGDEVLGSTTVNQDGSWSFTPTEDLEDGDHSLTVTSVDPAGNDVTSPAFDLTVDTASPGKPAITVASDDVGNVRGDLTSGSVTDDANPTLKGTAEAGSRVDIYDNGELIGSAVADSNGAWTFTPTTPLPEGEHRLTVTATDKAGNTGPASDEFVLSTDYTPPVATEDSLKITAVADDIGDLQGNVASGAITDDSQPAISGIGTAGNTVFVYTTDAAGKHLIGSAVVEADGTWSLTPDAPLLEGLNSLTLETQDPAGNRITGEAPAYDITLLIPTGTEPSIISVIDNSEPNTGALQKGDVTNDSTPTLNGTAAAGDIVTIRDGSTVLGSVTADSNGRWSFTPDTALADGNHNFAVTATDPAGNHKESGSFPVVIDTAAPSATGDLLITDNVGEYTGPVNDGDTTDDQSPTFSGTAQAGDIITVIDNGVVLGSAVAGDDGKWTYTPETPLAKGEHEVTTTVTDPAGNTSEPSPGVSFTVDTDPNMVTIGAVKDDQGPVTGNLTDGSVTDDARPELTGSGKPGSVVTVMDGTTVLGSTTVQPDGSWSFTPSADLSDGSHSLTVVSTDLAGGTVTSPAFDLTVDTASPGKPAITVASDDVGNVRGDLTSGSVTDDANPTLKGTAEAGSRVDIYDNGELIGSAVADNNGAWTFTPTTPLPEGEHRLTVTATDKAGNTGPASDEFVLSTDYSAPDSGLVTITGIYDDKPQSIGPVADGGITDDNRPRISGTGAEAGNIITVYNGTTVIGSTTVMADGTWSLEPTTPLADGLYTLTAKETDSVGNVSDPSNAFTFTLSTQAPPVPSLDSVYDDVAPNVDNVQKGEVTNDNRPTLNGSGLPGGTISIYDNGTLIGTATVGGNGSWSFTPDTALLDGRHNFTVTVTDSIGRVSPATGGHEIIIDTAAPSATSDLLITDDVGTYQGPVSNGDTTDDNTPTLSGKAEAGSTVNIIDNGLVIGTAVADVNGNWSYTPSTPLANGPHDLTTTVTDPSGNTGPEGTHVNIIVDVIPGQATIVAVKDDVGSVTTNVAQNGVTDDTRPEITGTAKAGSIVTITDGSTVLGSTTAGSDGSWSFIPTTDLAQGNHSFTATAKDPAGNDSVSGSWTITIDIDAPIKPSIDSAMDDVGSNQGTLANHGMTDDPTPTLSGKAEAGSIVKIYDQNGLLGSVTARADGTWSYTPTTRLDEGSHQFHVTATDKAGNTSDASDVFELVMDFTSPDSSKITITDVIDDKPTQTGSVAHNGETDDNRPLIQGTGAEAGDIITVYNGDKVIGSTTVKSDGTWELEPSSPLPNGTYVLTAKETDSVGNEAGPSNEYVFTVSTIAPQAPTLDNVYDDLAPGVDFLQKGDMTNDNTPTLSGTGVANGIISVYDNGTLIGTTTVASNGSWSFTPDTALNDGNHNFTATVTDTVGRVSPATGGFNIVVDTTVPSAVSDLLITDDVGAKTGPVNNNDTTDDNTPTISGKAEADSTVSIIDNGTVIGTAVADINGNWSFTPGAPLANGPHDITTKVTDTAGNTGPEGTHVNIIVDVTPGQAEITAIKDDVGDVTANVAQNGVTDDTRPEITGTAKAGSVVTITDGNNVLGSTTAGSDGNWSFTPTGDLGKGNHTFTATAKDPAGNDSVSSSWTITIDIDAPMKPSIDAANDDVGSSQGTLANHGMTDDPTPTLNGKAEAGSIVKIYDQSGLLGSVTARADGTWSYSPTAGLDEGSHQFYVTATDKAGNTSVASDNFELILDFTPPDSSKLAITDVIDDVGGVNGSVLSGTET